MNVKIKILTEKEEDIFISSPLIDSIYQMIEETYYNKKTIYLKNPTHSNPQELSDFLTYILAYPKGIETPKVIVSDEKIESKKEKERLFSNQNIVCFSGGVDSTGALLKLIDEKEEVIALWCDYGQPYKEPERKAVEHICQKLHIPLLEATLDLTDLIELGKEKFGHVFPARNLMIAAIALYFEPKNIVLAGLCDELVVPDKSLRMYNEFEKYFGIKLYSPFVKMTKTDVLCLWKKRWNRYISAFETVSCYSNQGNCQDCSSCAKREVAFVASDYSNEFPMVFKNQTELIENHWFSRVDIFGFERRTDMLIALSKYIDLLSPNLQKLVKENCEKYQKEIIKRKEILEAL